jgi:hypothetical protein
MNYKVIACGRGAWHQSHYVEGLSYESFDGVVPDTELIYHYPEGDIDTFMKDKDMMLAALYDLFQVCDDLHSGDTFDSEFGKFVCDGVHVFLAEP